MVYFDKSNVDQVSETFCGFEPLGKQAQLPDVAQVSEITERTRTKLCGKQLMSFLYLNRNTKPNNTNDAFVHLQLLRFAQHTSQKATTTTAPGTFIRKFL